VVDAPAIGLTQALRSIMNGVSETLPPLNKIAAALRKTTEVLAQELAGPTAAAPPWTDFEWHIARAVASMQGVSSLLYSRLQWRGPESWQRFLREQLDQSVARHLEITRVLAVIDSRARSAGVAFVALKGAALYARGVYAAGERPMGDIDLLIRDEDAEAIVRVLGSCGYEAAFSSHRHQTFQPQFKKPPTDVKLGEHLDNPINIEVHTRIAEHLPVMTVHITRCLLPHEASAGLNEYPSPASLMMHLLLHAAGNMRARALRLIQLHDIALLAARFVQRDWEELLNLRPDDCAIWWALPPLMLTARYYPMTIPPDVLQPLSMECPWLLTKRARRQRLTEVSWSNIRIEAFPGIEWSRSITEALAFMRSRIWPSKDALAELKQGAATIPGASTVPWYGIPHASRILRWIYSRPPRVQTLLSVRAALTRNDSVLTD
jgi:hypothetical protein